VGLVDDPLFLEHIPPTAHPETPERLRSILRRLETEEILSRVTRVAPRPARREELLRVHQAAYVDELAAQLPGQSGYLDADTYFSPKTWDAALHAAGGLIELQDRILDGTLDRGLALVRPPGHHAEPDRAMGFCLLSNVALAASAARARGVERVLIYDWDVHHGNGTQEAFYADPSVLFICSHQSPLYPGTGDEDEIGTGPGRGYTVNLPLEPGASDAELLHVVDEVVAPAARAFRPGLVLVSAGFDAHAHDPLAQLQVTTAGFGRMAARMAALADEVSGGRLLLALEGGYALAALAESVSTVLRALLEDADGSPTSYIRPVKPDVAALAQRQRNRLLALLGR
jgi:acetoin utilization deacetylase AcuC-like enzyme